MNTSNTDLQLATELRTTVSRLIKKLRNKSVSSEQLSLTERSTLALLDQHKELLPNELAAMEKITRQSMSQILNHLHQLGYIIKKTHDTDNRKTIISLSREGQNILYKVRNERDEWLQKALQETCSAKEQELIRKALAPLTKLVDFD